MSQKILNQEVSKLISSLEIFPLLNAEALAFFIDLQEDSYPQLQTMASDDLEEIRGLATCLAEVCHAASLEPGRRMAHDLVGLAATYGLERMARTAEAIGCAIRSNSTSFLTIHTDLLEELIIPGLAGARAQLQCSPDK